jgi:hypothetical protein
MHHTIARRLPFLLLTTAVLVRPAARADIEFSGIIEAGDNPTFGLDDPDTKTVKWVTTGQLFQGWTVTTYDEKRQTLLLTSDGAKPLLLHLKDAVIKESAPSKIEGNVVIKLGDKTITQSLALEADKASVIPLDDGTSLNVTLRSQPDGNVRYEMTVTGRPGPDGQPGEVLSRPTITAPPSLPASISIGGPDTGGGTAFAFSFTPKTAASAPTPPDVPASADAPVAP